MPGLTVPSRRSRTASEEDDQESLSEASGASGNKRPRLEDFDTTQAPPMQQSLGLPSPLGSFRDSGVTMMGTEKATARPTPAHQPGSIVRVTLKDFVTYSAATFHPGPELNMVIGPNGTGKSTLVCAICLGLGWGTHHLGRAKDIGEFVKHGSTEATTEIELKGRQGKINSIIKQHIKKEGNKRSWSINGQQSTLKQIQKLARDFNIQCDNLCQFLPQDRVVEFSNLKPDELLASTLRAAAPPYMTEMHEGLKEKRQQQRDLEGKHSTARNGLANLEGRQEAQREEVDKMNERRAVQDQVEMLEQIRPYAQYHFDNTKKSIAKERLEEAAGQLRRLKREVAPTIKAVSAKQAYLDAIKKAVNQHNSIYLRVQGPAEETLKERQRLEDKIKDKQRAMEAEMSIENRRKVKINKCRNDVRDLESRRGEFVVFDAPTWNERIRGKWREHNEAAEERDSLYQTLKDRRVYIDQKQGEVNSCNRRLEGLRSQTGQQLRKLEQLSRDGAQLWKRITEDRSDFEGHVYGPPIVECSLKDVRYADIVESALQKSDLEFFTCTTFNDFKKLTALKNSLGLRNIRLRTAPNQSLDHFRAESQRHNPQELDLDGWLLDFLEGPGPVLASLCAESRIHSCGVSLQAHTDEQYERVFNSGIKKWVTGQQAYMIRQRNEYAGFFSVNVSTVRSAKYFTDQGIDVQAEQAEKTKLAELQSEIEQLKLEHERQKPRMVEMKAQVDMLKGEHDELTKEKSALQKAQAAFANLPNEIVAKESELEAMLRQQADSKNIREEIYNDTTKLMLDKAEKSLQYASYVEQIRVRHSKLIAALIAQIEAQSDLETLEQRNQETKRRLDEAVESQASAEQVLRTRRKALKESIRAMDQLVRTRPDVKQFYESLSEDDQGRSPDELNLEIESQRARLELLQGGNPGALQEFEDRGRRIETLKRSLAEFDDSMASLTADITSIREKWEPELDELISRISNAFGACFEKIGCAGAVSVHKDGEDGRDFENWAIRIEVKFREAEELSVLDSHRQSGGERAVSTIFYLMALQTLSRAPFRVVDEINQGMDPRNERMVHERMVDIACGRTTAGGQGHGEDDAGQAVAKGSQYFLVTPKLLTGLKYSDGMTVHCIASGEQVPADNGDLNFGRIVMRARELGVTAA